MALASLTSKGQITIPSQVRHALGLEAGDRVEFVEQGKGEFAIVAATRSVRELKGLFQGKRSKPVSIEEMNAARPECGWRRGDEAARMIEELPCRESWQQRPGDKM
jgi:antitoxin PrlF